MQDVIPLTYPLTTTSHSPALQNEPREVLEKLSVQARQHVYVTPSKILFSVVAPALDKTLRETRRCVPVVIIL